MGKDYEVLLPHYNTIVRYLANLTGSPDAARDLAQEVYTRAHARVRTRGPPRHPLAWLKTIAHNCAIDAHERVLRRCEDDYSSVEVCISGHEDPLEEVVACESAGLAKTQVATALDALSTEDAYLVRGYYLDGKDCRTLSMETGVRYERVRMRIFRARARMRRALAKEEYPYDS